ncbi:Hypothetical protein SMAX5B_010757 [Scophthalmus maximus]|uniref:Uncharacterized protein n=1 Tax=Scophthalmus maximus TaxID=52904 RepID=A0A2U9BV42_SCOMX|nr:Hypothetical protein SMAX5B_010757 [Scophthalmus maximus]
MKCDDKVLIESLTPWGDIEAEGIEQGLARPPTRDVSVDLPPGDEEQGSAGQPTLDEEQASAETPDAGKGIASAKNPEAGLRLADVVAGWKLAGPDASQRGGRLEARTPPSCRRGDQAGFHGKVSMGRCQNTFPVQGTTP